MPTSTTAGRRRALLGAAMRVIGERYGDPDLDLADVAAAVGASTRQVQRVFREEAATDFRSALLGYRMKRAIRLLERGEPGYRVARTVGYRQTSGLRQALRRYTGKNPSHFHPPPPDYGELWRAVEQRQRSATDEAEQ